MNKKVHEAIQKYTEQFGGFPYYLFMSADDTTIINSINKALETNTKITTDNKNKDV